MNELEGEKKRGKKSKTKLSFIMLFWVVMGFGIGSAIWLIRIFIVIQQEGIYIANEPNTLILSIEIIFFITGVLLSIFMLIKVSNSLLEGMI